LRRALCARTPGDALQLTRPGVRVQIFDRTGLYRHRMSVTFEGFVYTVGDFVLRLGRVMGPARLLGIMLELEYRPVASYELAKQATDELIACVHKATAGLPGSFESVEEPRFTDYGLSAHEHSGRHTALSFVQVVAAIVPRREPGAAAPAAA
jgi:hypothetical protein